MYLHKEMYADDTIFLPAMLFVNSWLSVGPIPIVI